MIFAELNYVGIVVAAIASFAFGAVYYLTLAKPWMAAVGKTEEQMKGERSNPLPFIIAIAAQLVMAWALAGLIGHLGTEQMTVKNGVLSAGLIWFGFVLTSMAVNHGFQGARFSLTLIDSGHWLGVLLIQGLVLGLFGV